MGYCSLKQCDFPLRAQFGPGLVVHAALEYKKSANTYYGRRQEDGSYEKTITPEHMAIRLACSWRKKATHKDLIKNVTTITCKNCAKAIGMAEPKVDPKRFIIIRNDTGEYYKKTGYCDKWVGDPTDATLYRIKGVAKNFTIKRYYTDLKGNELSYNEYWERHRAGEQVVSTRRKHPNYDVKTVTISID